MTDLNVHPDLSLEFRSSVSMFATGVAIVSNTLDDAQVYGMTINSLTSICLTPPTLMISLKEGVMLDQVLKTRQFGVSILSKNQKDVSNNYSRKEKDSAYEKHFIVREKIPTLQDCLSWFECEVVKVDQYEDHTLVFGEVKACGVDNSAISPLLFFSSNYHFDPRPLN
ncbi:styrene monooxygenase NADH-dependent flavin reductase subunit StyB [Amphritea sp.]|uniref:styrene monooxygenase NADH-dependent flavin reductase subunit StyB n=1 Tax=Amphritea sp. TaxID=1872502 RepID=UPI0025BC5426|nr:flavin reductase family protein [Amphritea sp.]